MRSRFSRWDSTQDPWGPGLDVGELLDDLSDELLSGVAGNDALRNLHSRGLDGRARGLEHLRARLRRARLEAARQLDPAGPLEGLKERLDDILERERLELSSRDDEAARWRETVLDALPHRVGPKLSELKSYEWASADAGARFEQLLEELRGDVLDSFFKDLSGAMQQVTPDDVARMRDMIAELNDMIGRRERGEEVDFEGFMQRYGDMFPEAPRDLDELLETLARRMAAMSRLMAALSPEQRSELAEVASSVLADLDLAFEVGRLGDALRELAPLLPWDRAAPGLGQGDMPMSAAVDAAQRMAELEDLEAAAAGDYPGATIEDIDEAALRRALDEDAVADLRRLKAVERALEEAGIVHRRKGKLELTARGARMVGERSLTRLMERIGREPTHRARGGQAEATGATRRWAFGDSDPISVERTVLNAVTRAGPAPRGRGVKLSPGDFDVVETESRPRTATALLLDLSFSMPLGGHWVPAKRMALALHALIAGKYPQDSLYLVGFSDYARQMQPADLAGAGWEDVHGTNMQHAFLLARRLLADDPRAIKQVVMVTDGEPTAHLVGELACFNWPPVTETVEKTLREAARLARMGISINVFMLEQSPGLVAFMGRLARLTGGEVWPARSSEIGDVVVGNYLRHRPPL